MLYVRFSGVRRTQSSVGFLRHYVEPHFSPPLEVVHVCAPGAAVPVRTAARNATNVRSPGRRTLPRTWPSDGTEGCNQRVVLHRQIKRHPGKSQTWPPPRCDPIVSGPRLMVLPNAVLYCIALDVHLVAKLICQYSKRIALVNI